MSGDVIIQSVVSRDMRDMGVSKNRGKTPKMDGF